MMEFGESQNKEAAQFVCNHSGPSPSSFNIAFHLDRHKQIWKKFAPFDIDRNLQVLDPSNLNIHIPGKDATIFHDDYVQLIQKTLNQVGSSVEEMFQGLGVQQPDIDLSGLKDVLGNEELGYSFLSDQENGLALKYKQLWEKVPNESAWNRKFLAKCHTLHDSMLCLVQLQIQEAHPILEEFH